MTLAQVPVPRPGAGEVAIRVSHAGVSFAHALVVAGKYQRRPPLPFVPGTECSGVIESVGDGVTGLVPGQRVCAVLDWGGYAEVALARVEGVFPLDETLPIGPAIALPISFGTAYGALVWRGRLKPGQTVVVLGAAGGVGMAACQIARRLGARVLPVVGSTAKRDALVTQGFDETLVASGDTLRHAIAELTDGQGADLVFDPVGGAVFDPALRCLREGGVLLSIGYAGGTIPTVPANILLLKNIGVLGFNWGEYVGWSPIDTRVAHAPRVQAALRDLVGWWAAGEITPTLHASYPLEGFADAMAAVQERSAIGRVALCPGS